MQKRPKHEPADSYFYLSRNLSKCMVRANAFNSRVDPVRMEMTGMEHIRIFHVFDS